MHFPPLPPTNPFPIHENQGKNVGDEEVQERISEKDQKKGACEILCFRIKMLTNFNLFFSPKKVSERKNAFFVVLYRGNERVGENIRFRQTGS